MGLLARFLSGGTHPSEAPPSEDARRGAPYACAGCKRWATTPLAFLNNGQSYCLECARLLAASYGYRLVGRRADDVKIVD